MIYLLCVYPGEGPPARPLGGENLYAAACRQYERQLQQRGYLLAALSAPPGQAVVLQIESGQLRMDPAAPSVSPAGFVELVVLLARDLNEALRLAAEMPQARRGPIEIRPLELRYWGPPPD